MTATYLLTLALSLLMAAQQPHVTPEVKNMAINLANTAIAESMKELNATGGEPVEVPETASESRQNDAETTLNPVSEQPAKYIERAQMEALPSFNSEKELQTVGSCVYKLNEKGSKYVRVACGG